MTENDAISKFALSIRNIKFTSAVVVSQVSCELNTRACLYLFMIWSFIQVVILFGNKPVRISSNKGSDHETVTLGR